MNGRKGLNHYLADAYCSQERFNSYWMQFRELMSCRPGAVLEIGVGSGLLSWYLRKEGVRVTTMDIDESLGPDMVGDVLSIPLEDEGFDAVACFQALEHLPFDRLPDALTELRRITKGTVCLSIPDMNPSFRICIHVPGVGTFKKMLRLPRTWRKSLVPDSEHCWEIGKEGVTLKQVKSLFGSSGFDIVNTVVLFESPTHRFFRLQAMA